MSRDLAFRGKRLYDGIWVYGFPSLFQHHNGQVSGVIYTFHEDYPYNLSKVTTSIDPKTLTQYIGIKAGSTKEPVFEGDIIDVLDYEGDPGCGNMRRGVVHWSRTKMAIAISFTDAPDIEELLSDVDCDHFYTKIVGNVFDNYELVENLVIKEK